MKFINGIKFATTVAGMLQFASANYNHSVAMDSQLRLAYFGSHGMMVSWNTFSHLSSLTVHWGTSSNSLNNTASSEVSVTYATSTTYNNHVLISGLQPHTRYYYLPSHLLNDKSVEPFHFTTSRPAGDPTPYSVAVVVDLGTMGKQGLTSTAGKGVAENNILKPGEKNTIQSLEANKDKFEFLWHSGDIAYADYWLKEEIQGFLPNGTIENGTQVYEAILNDFYNQMMVITATKPYMVGVGNHEANCDNGGATDHATNVTYTDAICIQGQTNFTGYKNHFRMPGTVSGGTDNFWYSWNSGMVHYIQLDYETDLGHGFIGPSEAGGVEGFHASAVNDTKNAQTSWLEADLKSVDRTKTPWVIVAGHRPWYLSAKNESGTICWDCKDVFEPLFIKHNVDLVLSGHAHVYERLSPLAGGKMDSNGLNNPSFPWYITNGAAGHYDGLDALESTRKPYSQFGLDISDGVYGWSRLTFHNCTHMTHDFVASNNDTVLDSATLYKDRKCSFNTGLGSGSSPFASATSSGSGSGARNSNVPVTGTSAKTTIYAQGAIVFITLTSIFSLL